MADTDAKTSGGTGPESAVSRSEKKGVFGRFIQFIREIVAELKKVVTPTRKELVTFTLVVLAFVVFMMLLVTGLDLVFGKLAGWVFGGTPLW